MCIGVPVQVIEVGDYVALCRGINGDEHVNMMLIGDQPEGSWVLNYLGSARRVLDEAEAMDINQALLDLRLLALEQTASLVAAKR